FFHAYFVFFFQAEDGIRVLTVTGVQTCALPISKAVGRVEMRNSTSSPFNVRVLTRPSCGRRFSTTSMRARILMRLVMAIRIAARSEERRVGKEGRPRSSAELSEENRGDRTRPHP